MSTHQPQLTPTAHELIFEGVTDYEGIEVQHTDGESEMEVLDITMVFNLSLVFSIGAMGCWTIFALAVNHGVEDVSPIFATLIVYIIATITTLFVTFWKTKIFVPTVNTFLILSIAGVSLAGGRYCIILLWMEVTCP